MKLICETVEATKAIMEDNNNGGKNIFVEGPALVANVKNKNGRVYPLNILENEVNRYIKESVEKDRAVGELGHPIQANLNLERISHKFQKIWKEDNIFMARAKLLDTPMGQIAKNLVSEGVVLGFSSRGLGSLKPNKEGIMEVQNDFRLATAADIVADPSAPGAFVKGIMENVEWYYDIASGSWIQEKVEPLHNKMKNMSVKQLNENKVKLFEYYIKGLSKKRFV